MDTAAALSAGLTRTPARGWAVVPRPPSTFELPGIRPREVAVIASLVKTFSGLGFAMGSVVTGLVTQLTGSLQTGCVVLCGLTGVGVLAGLLYPGALQRAAAPAGS